MQQIMVIAPTADAATGTFDAGHYQWIIVAADELGGAEEVDVKNLAGSTFVVTADESATAVTLTATNPSRVLAGGTVYQFLKDAQDGRTSGVYVQLGPSMHG